MNHRTARNYVRLCLPDLIYLGGRARRQPHTHPPPKKKLLTQKNTVRSFPKENRGTPERMAPDSISCSTWKIPPESEVSLKSRLRLPVSHYISLYPFSYPEHRVLPMGRVVILLTYRVIDIREKIRRPTLIIRNLFRETVPRKGFYTSKTPFRM